MIEEIEVEIRKLKISIVEIERKIKFKEEVVYCLKNIGMTGALLYEASYEDEMCFDFEAYGPPPLRLQYDRRWIGFPEITEFDHLKEFILPTHYKFKKGGE